MWGDLRAVLSAGVLVAFACGGRTMDDVYWTGEGFPTHTSGSGGTLASGGGSSSGTAGLGSSCPWQCSMSEQTWTGICTCAQDADPSDGCLSSVTGVTACPAAGSNLRRCCSTTAMPDDTNVNYCRCLYEPFCPIESGRIGVADCPPH
jgi:hypothetical protein